MEKQYPLTKQQEGLWVEWRLHPENTSYNTCVKLRLSGPLDRYRLEKALQDIVQYFDSLKVYFVEDKGMPYQRIKSQGQYTLEFFDYSDGDSPEDGPRKKKALAKLAEKVRTPVDLGEFPIIRAALIRTAPHTHYLIGLVPHVISDGVSAIMFLESASIAYNEGWQGLEKAYGPTKKDWDDYFSYMAGKHDPAEDAAATAHWKKRLADAKHYIDFSYGRVSPDPSDKRGKRIYFDISPERSTALKKLSRKRRTTLFNALVAVFGIFVNRYFGEEDILIGYPVNIRAPGYKHLFGFFVNIIALRVDLSGDPTFYELLDRITQVRKEDKKYQKYPALEIVRGIRETVSDFDGRVFNLSMAQTVSRLVNLNLEGIQSDPLEVDFNEVNEDLVLSYELLDDRIGLWLEYRYAVFDEALIEQAITHIQKIMACIVAEPEAHISAYPLLAAPENEKILNTWNQSDRINFEGTSIHGLVESAAAKHSECAALIGPNNVITYAQMNNQANQMARVLQNRGVQKGDKVALCLHRGADQLISLLAILKTGSAYIPIPTDYPTERINYILNDTQASAVIINDEKVKHKIPQSYKLLVLNATRDERLAQSNQNLDVVVEDQDLAYVIYTSGSTGKPKGVLLRHGNVTPRLIWLQDQFRLTPEDRMLQNTDYSFDVSVAEIFWPLTSGAAHVLTEPEKNKDPAYLIGLMQSHQVTCACFVPSVLNALLGALATDKLTCLKTMLACGEVLSASLKRSYYEKCSGDLHNFYGPTEAAIYATSIYCDPKDTGNSVPIGRPMGETIVYILDRHMQPVPPGVAGELYIGGAGVAAGYLNQPNLTAGCFIKDPFNANPDTMIYKTGDLARYLPDGNIDFLGRMDGQVKVRGFRIELTEIESVLIGCEGIEDIAVIDYGDTPETKRLVAYYVSSGETELKKMKRRVCEQLPPYMAPAFYVGIDEIPRTASDKINRKALPRPEGAFTRQKRYEAPRNRTEKWLVSIWADILKVSEDKIGIHDSFFDMGGDSLMAIQFACAAQENNLQFKTNALFEHRTIAALSEVVTIGSGVKREIDQSPVKGRFPLMPRQAKFFADGFTNPNHWNRFVLFRANHRVEEKALRAAIDQVLMHHDGLRVRFVQEADGTWMQESEDCLPDAGYWHIYETADKAKMVQIINNHQASLDLSKPPLIQAVLIHTGPDSGKLAIISHHLLLDMVTSRILFEDLIKAYEFNRHGISGALPPKTTALKAWATHVAASAHKKDFEPSLARWRHCPQTPVPAIPLDHPDNRDQNLEGRACSHSFSINSAATENLLRDIPAVSDYRIQDVCIAALYMVLAGWTHEKELFFNTCGHGREANNSDFDISRTVGWLNTVFPVHLKCNDGSFEAILAQTKQQMDRLLPDNGDYNVLRYLVKHTDILKHDNPEIFFNYVSQIDAFVADGLPLQPIPSPEGIQVADPQNHLCYLLYFEAGVVGGQLVINLTYSDALFSLKTIETLCRQFTDRIESGAKALMARYCVDTGTCGLNATMNIEI